MEDSNMIVSELFLSSNEGWDNRKLHDLFNVAVVQQILSILIPLHRGSDQCIWKHNRDGNYSVKSGYMVTYQVRDHKIDVPASTIATELRKRQVECDVICCRCGFHEESLEHCLRDYPWSLFFWQASPLRLSNISADRTLPFRDWMDKIRKVEDHQFHNLFAVLLCTNWKNRNELIFKEIHTPHQVCFDIAVRLHNEYQDLLQRSAVTNKNQEVDGWEKPPEGF
ncbi:hypothetical protein C2S51_017671 [Perilla frutescens var. frutescens]|nr:hypothetical protein C2S51_017671 [Perilla frutescens var. frutescens]